jgi:dTDP-4-amino-4,6-dideoxygalactose transaminase
MIKLSKSSISDLEKEAVLDVLDNEYLGMGSYVKEFEKSLSSFFNSDCVCVSTGTAALQLAVEACGIGEGDEILVPSLTYVASFQAISATGAIPVPCDVNPHSLNICLEDIKLKTTMNTKAIMPVFYAGNPEGIFEILNYARNANLRVISDAAHAFGSKINSNLIGSFGDISCFSFDGIKNITSGEGGCIVSNDKKIIEYVKDARLLGVKKDTENRYLGKRSWDFQVTNQGWRYHMSNIMAAIGIVQLNRFNSFKTKRQECAIYYNDKLKGIDNLVTNNFNYSEIVPHIYPIRILNNKRDDLKQYLEENDIQIGLHYKPNHLLDFYKTNSKLKNTEEIYEQLITLPLHYDLEYSDIDYVCSHINKFFYDK